MALHVYLEFIVYCFMASTISETMSWICAHFKKAIRLFLYKLMRGHSIVDISLFPKPAYVLSPIS
ncbi:uncharacterized protein RHIMIDRAFT_92692 [Rhizopus microsporus ATCC 52813]|uniref:Uncharacterized protein n=1 Tax=Rhizopus microsporus ATCC 52813 TaxID=1340429 RepID=A0A2G4T409_RHIZD|nr:uncharacterized protein RHIMIDRAFT_92692 [Rhizopus microsporus ATCC 52813]PHZ15753.1 hypothetical protein RHIMIDRAFT_92692 [Rhizopus microsporus ATCC 52813]